MIEFDHVTRSYGQKPAVSDLSLAIPRGELFALLGPNGAGKTTTIKMLVGLLRPSRGAVRVCGAPGVSDGRIFSTTSQPVVTHQKTTTSGIDQGRCSIACGRGTRAVDGGRRDDPRMGPEPENAGQIPRSWKSSRKLASHRIAGGKRPA